MLQQSSLFWNKKSNSEFEMKILLLNDLCQSSKLNFFVTLCIMCYTIMTEQIFNLHFIDFFLTLIELFWSLVKSFSASLWIFIRADDFCYFQYSFTQHDITSESEILLLKLSSKRYHTFSVSISSMFESLNFKRTHLNQLIVEKKLLWKLKIKDELFWKQTATMFKKKFHWFLSSSDLKQCFNRFKKTKAQIVKINFTLFVSSCWLLSNDSFKRNFKTEYWSFSAILLTFDLNVKQKWEEVRKKKKNENMTTVRNLFWMKLELKKIYDVERIIL